MNQVEPDVSPALERLGARLSDRQLVLIARAYEAIVAALLSAQQVTSRVRELGASSRSNGTQRTA